MAGLLAYFHVVGFKLIGRYGKQFLEEDVMESHHSFLNISLCVSVRDIFDVSGLRDALRDECPVGIALAVPAGSLCLSSSFLDYFCFLFPPPPCCSFS